MFHRKLNSLSVIQYNNYYGNTNETITNRLIIHICDLETKSIFRLVVLVVSSYEILKLSQSSLTIF